MKGDAGGTIVGLASPAGPGLRGILRVSGPHAWRLVEAVWRGGEAPPDRTRRGFFHGRFFDGVGELPLLLLWMPGPRSFTREDVAELHLPGSPPLLDRCFSSLLALGARAARAGEFTRRAFENGRIDLTRAEGVLALVSARSAAEARGARGLLFGGLGGRIEVLREELERLRALCEASLDFEESDTGDVPGEELLARARKLLAGLREAERWEARRVPASGLPRVVLLGAPNAGKSSLFNALAEEGEALVSTLAGTTRDFLGAPWSLPGGEVRLFDTAGLDRDASGLDAEAQAETDRMSESADLLLWVVDASEAGAAERCEEVLEPAAGTPVVVAWNKSDLVGAIPAPELEADTTVSVVSTSAIAHRGLTRLASEVARRLGTRTGATESTVAELDRELSARHRAALRCAAEALEQGLHAWLGGIPLDLLAEELRTATAELDSISGRTTPEDLLDRIFGAFCIGK